MNDDLPTPPVQPAHELDGCLVVATVRDGRWHVRFSWDTDHSRSDPDGEGSGPTLDAAVKDAIAHVGD